MNEKKFHSVWLESEEYRVKRMTSPGRCRCCGVEGFGGEENIIIIFLIQKPLLRSFIIFYIFFFHSYSFHSFLIQNNSPQRFERRTNRGIHVISLCYAHDDDMQMNGMAIINNDELHPTRHSEVSRIGRRQCSVCTYMGCLSRGWAFIAKIYTQSLVIISHISLTSRNHVRLKLTLNQRESSSFCVVECREEHTCVDLPNCFQIRFKYR